MYDSLGTHMPACYLPNTLRYAQTRRQQAHPGLKRAQSVWEQANNHSRRGQVPWQWENCRGRVVSEQALDPDPGVRGVKDVTQSFRKGIQVRQPACARVTWSFSDRRKDIQKVCWLEGGWPIKTTANSITIIREPDLEEEGEGEKRNWGGWRKHSMKDRTLNTTHTPNWTLSRS